MMEVECISSRQSLPKLGCLCRWLFVHLWPALLLSLPQYEQGICNGPGRYSAERGDFMAVSQGIRPCLTLLMRHDMDAFFSTSGNTAMVGLDIQVFSGFWDLPGSSLQGARAPVTADPCLPTALGPHPCTLSDDAAGHFCSLNQLPSFPSSSTPTKLHLH